MKLKEFEKSNEKSGKPFLRFNRKTGLFTISKPMERKIGITDGGKIKFFQDEDSPKDWYVCLDENGFYVRRERGTFFMNNAGLARELIKTLNIPDDCNSFIIGAPTELNGTNYFPLLLNKINY